MPREDSLSSRFDYLFEPLDDETTVGDADAAAGERSEEPANPSATPMRMAFAAFLLASLGFVTVIASVAPETRAPFPNQGPQQGGNGAGGLLGVGGLL